MKGPSSHPESPWETSAMVVQVLPQQVCGACPPTHAVQNAALRVVLGTRALRRGREEVRWYGRAPPQRWSWTSLPRRRSRPWLQCSEGFAPARAAHAYPLWPSGSWLHCAGIGVLVGVTAAGASTDAMRSSLAPPSAPPGAVGGMRTVSRSPPQGETFGTIAAVPCLQGSVC
jgi:hypothetical protein